MTTKITNRRKKGSRKKWVMISVTYTNGITDQVTQFRSKHPGDSMLYVKQLQSGNTITEIFID